MLALFENPLATTSSAVNNDDELYILDLQEESGYQTNYARLTTVGSNAKNYTANIKDPKLFLASSLANIGRLHSGKVAPIIQQLLNANAKANEQLSTYMNQSTQR